MQDGWRRGGKTLSQDLDNLLDKIFLTPELSWCVDNIFEVLQSS